MVSVHGQMSEPLVDLASVRQEYWNRKTVELPSLAQYNKQKGWRRWFWNQEAPVLVLRRLSEEEWSEINAKFHDIKIELAKEIDMLRHLVDKMMQGELMTEDEMKVLHAAKVKAMPIYIGMLEMMIEKPEVDYEGARLLLDACDQRDKDTLMAFVDMLSSEKMKVAQAIYNEQLQDIKKTEAEMLAKYNG